jgi:hypothetical protein
LPGFLETAKPRGFAQAQCKNELDFALYRHAVDRLLNPSFLPTSLRGSPTKISKFTAIIQGLASNEIPIAFSKA